jgi:hypothetical protein
MNKTKKQFCKHGHDTFVTGRTKSRACIVCSLKRAKEYQERTYKAHPRKLKKFCPRGHSIKTFGRTKYGQCRKCHGMKTSIYSKNHPRSTILNRKSILKLRFHMTIEDYEKLFKKQKGKCAICGSKDSQVKRQKYFCIDRDHKCCPTSKSCGKCIRGLLCQRCNSLLGYSYDNINILRNAIKYLRKF